jgi:hypothetical protein
MKAYIGKGWKDSVRDWKNSICLIGLSPMENMEPCHIFSDADLKEFRDYWIKWAQKQIRSKGGCTFETCGHCEAEAADLIALADKETPNKLGEQEK